MTVHNLYIFDRNGSCLYYNEWNRKKQAGISKDETSKYRLHYYETPSGLRFILNTDLSVVNARETLQSIYSSSLDSELFGSRLDAFIRALPYYNGRADGRICALIGGISPKGLIQEYQQRYREADRQVDAEREDDRNQTPGTSVGHVCGPSDGRIGGEKAGKFSVEDLYGFNKKPKVKKGNSGKLEWKRTQGEAGEQAGLANTGGSDKTDGETKTGDLPEGV
ncbi:Trafficking protein particle complex subunit 1 [Dissostichus eleginoides]|uniref:Trafficking protein particle complex subunit n=1 Tax=Dissostichus eleginoides TaxID=100907 RepID=A0AAD9ESR9_DISEL|nr:Trafficking protein particle complex subunit 1 [Dissostichus eleginoides]